MYRLLYIRDQYRLLCAHWDRRSLSSYVLPVLPHLMNEGVFGPVEDCPLCKDIKVSPEAYRMLQELKKNGISLFNWFLLCVRV